MDWHNYTIKEITKILASKNSDEINNELIDLLKKDSRVGVQKLAIKYQKLINYEKERLERWKKMNEYTARLNKKGYELIAGIDEAGRGPLAGPVVAAAVIINPDKPIYGLDDSKKLTEKRRDELYSIIYEDALSVGVGIVDNQIIDRINILQATFKAMAEAIKKFPTMPDYIIVDGNMEIPSVNIKQKAIINGDALVSSIAAASIVAKVYRDRIIESFHQKYPEFGFDRNKGYGTSEHIEALKSYGPTPIHRYSFSIVNKYHFLHCKNNIRKAQSENELNKLGNSIAKYSLFSQEKLKILRKLYHKKYNSIVNQ